MQELIEAAGAVDGGQGVEMAGSELPALILMDMSLPVIDGWEATRRIKAAEATRHIPVIGLTAHAMAGDEEKSAAAGMNDHQTKPMRAEQIAETAQSAGAGCALRPASLQHFAQ